jgi:hypothetical protein
MADLKNIRVAVNGYGVIGKRVAAAVTLQGDMSRSTRSAPRHESR